jgi:hypothetical protein
MTWVADSFELAVSASAWARAMELAPRIGIKLRKAALRLLEPEPDMTVARKIAKIALKAGFAGPELDRVLEGLAASEWRVMQPTSAASTKKRSGKSAGNAKTGAAAKGKEKATDPVIMRRKQVAGPSLEPRFG